LGGARVLYNTKYFVLIKSIIASEPRKETS
jgi:hypothetical protein